MGSMFSTPSLPTETPIADKFIMSKEDIIEQNKQTRQSEQENRKAVESRGSLLSMDVLDDESILSLGSMT